MGRARYHRYIIGLFLIFLAVCAAVPHGRAENETDNAAEAENEQDLKRITGTVAKVSFVFSTLVLTCELGYLTFKVTDDTDIIRGPSEIGLEEIKTGETITIQYSQPYPSEYIAVYIRASEESYE
jgi:hypothetical protein